MVLAGSLLGLATVSAQAIVLWHGVLTPLAFFLPGFFITMSQGIAMPYAQAGAINEIPRFAGTAAGVGVFMQNFFAALFAQLYGLFADGSPLPMSMLALLGAVLGLAVGLVPFKLARRRVTP
jgi:DHA1 family bicyclomycin/chloramphenicol resistance-like MFS transporter